MPRTTTRPAGTSRAGRGRRAAAATPARARRPAARRAPARGRRRSPALSPEMRRELAGIAALGAAVVTVAVLALPDGGTVAGPVHDALLGALGVGAWLGAMALAVAGVRVLGRRGWTGGVLGAVGGLVAVAAVLGLLGLVAPDSAGGAGRRLGSGLGHRLGEAAAGAALLLAACLGTVVALELRVGRAAAAVVAWWRNAPEPAAEEAGEAEPWARPERGAGAEATVQTPSEPARVTPPADGPQPPSRQEQSPAAPMLPLEAPAAVPLEALGLDGAPDPVAAAAEPGTPTEPLAPFVREFEGRPVGPERAPAAQAPAAPPAPTAAGDEPERVWTAPSADLLDVARGRRERLEQEIKSTAATIISTLDAFGIESRVVGVNSGPTVTQYELQPAKGVPVRKITGHQTDLSLSLAAPIRIQAPIPGKAAIGIEVPNKAAQLVTLKEIVQTGAFTDPQRRLAVALGADVSGHPVVGDLCRMPHLLIAGATGSGKSVCINAILAGFLLQATPAELKLILIDPKRVELTGFADVPHLLVPVVVEQEAAVASLRWAVREMEERYKLFAAHGARNIAAFNERAPQLGLNPLPYTVIVIDELADLMMVAAGEIEDLICRIAQLARAVGIHLIVATQRPSADIITGLIKANIPSRVAFAVSSGVDSRVILDEMGAEKLLGRGDMLYLPIDEGKPRRLQGAFVSDSELERLITTWKEQGLPDYQEEVFQVEATVTWARDAGKRDPLFARAAHTVAAEGRAAASLLQRKLNVGYTRAARLVDQLAEHRVVGPFEGSKSREVLMDVLAVDELLAELGDE